jgi:hypothetical protein
MTNLSEGHQVRDRLGRWQEGGDVGPAADRKGRAELPCLEAVVVGEVVQRLPEVEGWGAQTGRGREATRQLALKGRQPTRTINESALSSQSVMPV